MEKSGSFSRSLESSSLEIPPANKINYFKDNYSIEEIAQVKMKRLTDLFKKVTNLYENESSLPPERSCVQFATFLKEKINYINSLMNTLRMTEPSAFPRFRAEGYIQVKETLDAVNEDLKNTEKMLKLRREHHISRIESSINRCNALEEIMKKSKANENTSVLKNEIKMKLSDEKLKTSKKDLKYNLDKVFSGNKPLKDILEALVEASGQSSSNNRWITIDNNTDISVVMLLKLSGIIKSHPLDESMISLVSFN